MKGRRERRGFHNCSPVAVCGAGEVCFSPENMKSQWLTVAERRTKRKAMAVYFARLVGVGGGSERIVRGEKKKGELREEGLRLVFAARLVGGFIGVVVRLPEDDPVVGKGKWRRGVEGCGGLVVIERENESISFRIFG
ncbi:hypothetical protein HAX54_024020 [Datura stramonium]|uniref:Uncharacterized protein n=1 Tax=Datura stramonium TaxID=4076 RepID=A0ABS8S5F0_DATST|nr:hypothetical protein [Datura stramonium]